MCYNSFPCSKKREWWRKKQDNYHSLSPKFFVAIMRIDIYDSVNLLKSGDTAIMVVREGNSESDFKVVNNYSDLEE